MRAIVALIIIAALAKLGYMAYLNMYPEPTPAPVAAQPDPPPPPPRTMSQCVDAAGKITWSDQGCASGEQALSLTASKGNTYRSSDSMDVINRMPAPRYMPANNGGGGAIYDSVACDNAKRMASARAGAETLGESYQRNAAVRSSCN